MNTSFSPSVRAIALGAATFLSSLAASPAWAGPTGDWQTLGDVYQSSRVFGIELGQPAWLLGTASVDYADDAPLAAGELNLSGRPAADVSTLTAALGLSGDALDDPLAGRYAYEGSALWQQDLVVHAGDTLSLDWRLLGQASLQGESVPDTAWLVLGTQLIRLSDTEVWSQNAQGWRDSGQRHFSHTFTESGAIKVGFVLADVNSYDTTSVLAVSAIGLTQPVPEPANLALALTGLVILGRLSARGHQR
jgi:hypothetical protein